MMLRSIFRRHIVVGMAIATSIATAAVSLEDDSDTRSSAVGSEYGRLENSSRETDVSQAAEEEKREAVTKSLQELPILEDPSLNAPKAVPLPPFEDVGTPELIAKVKADFVAAMDGDGDIMKGPTRPSNLEQLVSAVYAEAVVPEQLLLASEAWGAQLADASYTPFTADLFEVSQWQGIRVSGLEAHVQVLAVRSYLVGSWAPHEPEQYQVDLTLEDGLFKVVRSLRVDPYCEGANCNDSISP